MAVADDRRRRCWWRPAWRWPATTRACSAPRPRARPRCRPTSWPPASPPPWPSTTTRPPREYVDALRANPEVEAAGLYGPAGARCWSSYRRDASQTAAGARAGSGAALARRPADGDLPGGPGRRAAGLGLSARSRPNRWPARLAALRRHRPAGRDGVPGGGACWARPTPRQTRANRALAEANRPLRDADRAARAGRGGPAPEPEDGGHGPADRRRRPRLQQPADGGVRAARPAGPHPGPGSGASCSGRASARRSTAARA